MSDGQEQADLAQMHRNGPVGGTPEYEGAAPPGTPDDPRFSAAEIASRHARLREEMARDDLDVLLLYGTGGAPQEVLYVSDFPVTREAVVLLPREGEPVLLAQYFNHLDTARRESRIADVRWASEDTAATTAGILERSMRRAKIGVVGALPWRFARVLGERLPEATLRDWHARFMVSRLRKSAEEFAFLRRGAELSDRAIAALAREARPGLTERDLVAVIESAYLGLGGTTHIHYLATTPMASPAACVPAQIPSARVLATGDILLTEISAQYRGYPGQILRPFAIATEPTSQYARLYDVAATAFQEIAAVIRPGARTDDVLDIAERVITGAGYTICDDLVHGFGGGYLPPIIRTRETGGSRPTTFTFEEDMAVVIQPNVITHDRQAGVQVGELVRVTSAGVESLHTYPRQFIQCAKS